MHKLLHITQTPISIKYWGAPASYRVWISSPFLVVGSVLDLKVRRIQRLLHFDFALPGGAIWLAKDGGRWLCYSNQNKTTSKEHDFETTAQGSAQECLCKSQKPPLKGIHASLTSVSEGVVDDRGLCRAQGVSGMNPHRDIINRSGHGEIHWRSYWSFHGDVELQQSCDVTR